MSKIQLKSNSIIVSEVGEPSNSLVSAINDSVSVSQDDIALDSKHEAYFTGKRVQITKDGANLLCESSESVGIMTLANGQISGKIECENDVVTCISLSPDNSSLIVALRSTSVRQYDWPGLELQRTFRSYHRGPITVMDWDASSTLLITAASDSSARIWDLQKKFCTHSLKGASGVFGTVMFHPDLMKKPYVYGSAANNIHIWNLSAGSSSLVGTLEGHHSHVTSIQLSSDNSHLVSCGFDRVLILWDLITMKSKRIIPVMESLSGMVLQPPGVTFPGAKVDDGYIYSLVVGDKGVPSVWQVDTGRQVWKASEPILTTPEEEGVSLINQLLYCPAIQSVIFTTYDHSILFAKQDTLDVWKQLSGHNDQILGIIFAGIEDSHLIMATNSADIRIYDVKTFSCHLVRGHTGNVYSLSRHPTNCNLFASSSHDSTARLWKLKTNGTAVCIGTAVGHTQSIGCVALSEGFMITGSNDMCVKRWNITELEKQTDDNLVSLSSTHTQKAHDKDINSLCVSVNNKLIATGSQDRTAKIWNSKDLTLLGILDGHRRGLWSVEFSPVDEVVATASGDGTIKIWTLQDFRCASTLEGHGVGVMGLKWISLGQQLLSVGADGLLKMWTVKTRQCLQTYDDHDDRIWDLAVSQDEMKVVTGGEDASLIIWKDVTQEEKDKEIEEAARLAAEEQALSNLIKDKKWAKALGIAIRLDQPFRALKIVKRLLDEDPDQLPIVLKKFRHDQLMSILKFASQWNTKTKDCRESQTILKIVISTHTPEELEGMKEWQQLLEGLIPYTEKHFRRLSALHQSSSILKYMSTSLCLGEPQILGAEQKPTSDLELLRSISAFPEDNSEENESDEDDVDDSDDDLSKDVKEAIKDSVLELDEDESMSDDDENTSQRNEDDSLDSDKIKMNINKIESVDGLDANFIVEIVQNSDVEGSEHDDMSESDIEDEFAVERDVQSPCGKDSIHMKGNMPKHKRTA